MELNNQKFEFLSHRLTPNNMNQKFFEELPFNNNSFDYKVSNSIIISPSLFVKDLGIFVDKSLNWDIHLNKITSKARQMCAWILSVFYTRDKCTLLTLFNSLVRSRLEYCSEIWNPFLIKDILKI